MGAKNPVRQSLSSRIAITTRHHPDSPELPALRDELAAVALEEHICKVVGAWPPLSDGQRTRLALLLHPGAGHAS